MADAQKNVLSFQDSIENRRKRGEVSCAECRRLKLKCDKKVPCGSCVRRGHYSICPNGTSTGRNTRFVLADIEKLRGKIAEMGGRIRQLEDALSIFQASVSPEPHPLLQESLLSIKFTQDVLNQHETDPSPEGDVLDAPGTLTIRADHKESYFGRSGGTETLFMAAEEMERARSGGELPAIFPELAQLSGLFPFLSGGAWHSPHTLDALLALLPPRPRAWALCETYTEQATWSFRPIRREEYVDEILAPIYQYTSARARALANPSDAVCVPHPPSPHKLSVLFTTCALGALVDLTLPAYNAEAEKYFQLGLAALALQSMFDAAEIATVQAVALQAVYHMLAGKGSTRDRAWSIVSFGCKLAQTIGLHRDGSRWNMDPKTIQRRRSLFWEIYTLDNFGSLALGRPPAITPSYIDCQFPSDEGRAIDESGQPVVGFWEWKYSFTKEIFAAVSELTLTAAPPKYEVILELDRRVRERLLPDSLNTYFHPDAEYSPGEYMQGCLLAAYRSVAMLYIHRSFFAQAMLDFPKNPLQSPYAPSYLAAYRCASAVIKSNKEAYERFPDLCVRWWTIWTHLFSAAIIMGSIVTRAPGSTIAGPAFSELKDAFDLFQSAGMYSRRARNGLTILTKLMEKAKQTYSRHEVASPVGVIEGDDDPDELAIFGGQTRVLFSKILPNEEPGDVHPSLVEYLNWFPVNSSAEEELSVGIDEYWSSFMIQSGFV